MIHEKYKPLRTKLLQERERVVQLVRAESAQQPAPLHDASYGPRLGDEGTEPFATRAMHGNLRIILEEVDHALQEMDADMYGRCDRCGDEIPFERLAARPQATLCIKCKNKVEHSRTPTHIDAQVLSAVSPGQGADRKEQAARAAMQPGSLERTSGDDDGRTGATQRALPVTSMQSPSKWLIDHIE